MLVLAAEKRQWMNVRERNGSGLTNKNFGQRFLLRTNLEYSWITCTHFFHNPELREDDEDDLYHLVRETRAAQCSSQTTEIRSFFFFFFKINQGSACWCIYRQIFCLTSTSYLALVLLHCSGADGNRGDKTLGQCDFGLIFIHVLPRLPPTSAPFLFLICRY